MAKYMLSVLTSKSNSRNNTCKAAAGFLTEKKSQILQNWHWRLDYQIGKESWIKIGVFPARKI